MSTSKTKNSHQKRVLKEKLANGRTHVSCCFCRRRMLIASSTLEHKTPLVFGGSWSIDNLALSCDLCNNDRGVSNFEEYKRWRRGKTIEKPINKYECVNGF